MDIRMPGAAILILGIVLTAATLPAQSMRYVDAAAPPGGDGATWATAYDDLQDALAEAAGGAGPWEVWVAAGTYRPALSYQAASFVLVPGLALYGGFSGSETQRDERDPAANVTVLSGDLFGDDITGPGWGWSHFDDNSLHVLVGNGADATTILDGFVIRGGTGTSSNGGGLFIQGGSPTIRNCIFRYNAASFSSGAAIYCLDGSPVVEDCLFEWNWVHMGKGGGLAIAGNSQPEIRRCRFEHNRVVGAAAWAAGAGIFTESPLRLSIEECDFLANTAENFYPIGATSGAFGAGIYVMFGGADIWSCTFRDNFAHAGAGVFNWVDGTVIAGCLFEGNTVVPYSVGSAAETGGGGAGVAVMNVLSTPRTTFVTQCTFAGNQANEGAGAISYGAHLLECTNSIFWGNVATSPDVWGAQRQLKGDTSVSYCCVEDLYVVAPGEDPVDPADVPGCIDLDPLFVDAAAGDLHLAAGSPCIDAGDSSAVPTALPLDLDGLPRIVDDPAAPDTGSVFPAVDIGVYESAGMVPGSEFVRGDCNSDGAHDIADPIGLLGALFTGATTPPCLDACDDNDDGTLDISDAVHALAVLFAGAPPPPPPWPACGADPTPDPLGCVDSPACP